jgi:hypothetical protein
LLTRDTAIEPVSFAERCAGRSPYTGRFALRFAFYAAFNHIAVSKALLIIGMFMPKLAFAAAFEAGLRDFSVTLGATSAARSHDPISWERATEKNRNT